MLFVRNPTGVSHSPDEHAETADCLAGVEALADVLDRADGARDGVPPRAGLASGGCVPRRRAGRGRGRPVHLRHARRRPAARRPGPRPRRARASPTPTATPSTAPCAAAPSASAGTFWTWRDQMYDVAARLDPDTYLALARATYREMAAAGITCVGEFHYLHHQPDGTPYADPDEMGEALVEAARQAGIRITLLDTLYLSVRLRRGARGRAGALQRRVGRGVGRAGGRASRAAPHAVAGDARVHSVRAVPARPTSTPSPPTVGDRPFHVHLSEQVAENERLPRGVRRHAGAGCSPTTASSGRGTSLVHATHLSDDDIALIGAARAHVSFCPTTERDLGDGIGPSRRLHDAGARLTLGLRQPRGDRPLRGDAGRRARRAAGHPAARPLERRRAARPPPPTDRPRLARLGRRGRHRRRAARRPRRPRPGVSPRTAGAGRDENAVVFAATAEDVRRVMVDGRWVVEDGDRAATSGTSWTTVADREEPGR